MNAQYHDTIAALEAQGVARDYIIGWASACLGSPKREAQRLNPAYEAGYADGAARHTDNAGQWKTAGKGAGKGAADGKPQSGRRAKKARTTTPAGD